MSFSTLSLISASKLQHRPGCFQEQLVCLWCLVPSTGNSCIHIFIAPHRAICHCCSGSLFTVFLFEFKFVLLCVLSIVFDFASLPCELICHVHVRSVLLFFFIYTYFPHDLVWAHGSSSGQCCLFEDIKRLDVMRQVFVISTSYSVILLKSHFIIGLPLYI